METKSNNKKVLVGMSGGIDSSVSAMLLQKAGYEVSGVFLEFHKNTDDDYKKAKKIADFLNISLCKIDAKKEFKEKIIDYFIKEYEAGQTSNPCVICNPQMKFKVLLAEMEKQNADIIATGHYARLLQDNSKNKRAHLFIAKDKFKDQSYFLAGLKQSQLQKIIFPLGDLLKSEVKKIAEEIKLPVIENKESQDVCFIQNGEFGDFLRKYIKKNEGDIIDITGNVLGKHNGLHFYTIGQRRGIELGGGPYYVCDKDIKNNKLIVTNDKKDKKLYTGKILVKNINWIVDDKQFPLRILAKIRYQKSAEYAIITKAVDNLYEVEFENSQWAVTPGQQVVFYSKLGEVLGGGKIV